MIASEDGHASECSGADVTGEVTAAMGVSGGRGAADARGGASVLAWNSAATERSRASSSGGPTSCIDRGSPPEKPIGSATAGRPATLPAAPERIGVDENSASKFSSTRGGAYGRFGASTRSKRRKKRGERALRLAAQRAWRARSRRRSPSAGSPAGLFVRVRRVGELARPARPDELLERGRRLGLDEEVRERLVRELRERGRLEERARLAEDLLRRRERLARTGERLGLRPGSPSTATRSPCAIPGRTRADAGRRRDRARVARRRARRSRRGRARSPARCAPWGRACPSCTRAPSRRGAGRRRRSAGAPSRRRTRRGR